MNTNFHAYGSDIKLTRLVPETTINDEHYWLTSDKTGNADGIENSSKRKIRLLIIDDDDVDRENLNRFVKKSRLPINIENAESGYDALRRINHGDIDLILLDYQLGDMTGTELLSKIKNDEEKLIPAIMITGMGDETTAIEAMRLGVYDYLPKNQLTSHSLIKVLKSALHAAKIEEQLMETQKRLKRMSLYDELTCLPNRNLFFDRVNQIILGHDRYKKGFSLLMMDLNFFKEVNDSLGHQAGDRVLKVIGERLQMVSRKSDTVARLGGDEFVCILQESHKVEDAVKCSEKFLAAISEPILSHGELIQIGASIGIANFPEHGHDANSLLSNADSAMYKAKRSSRNIVVYDPEECESPANVTPMSQLLHKAIKEDELFLEFQPQVNMQTKELLGLEVLTRWNSPKLGLIMPGSFIHAAERSALIENLTYKIITMAFEQIRDWNLNGLEVPVSINISARMLDHQLFAHWIMEKIEQYNINVSDIILEITETTLCSSSSSAQVMLQSLAEAGFKISIDDFGKGFTSFKNIRDVFISELKIDSLFVENIHSGSRDMAIVRSLLSLARSLGLNAVAEGVETQEQWDLLRQMGCPSAQGFAIAKPMQANNFTIWKEEYEASLVQ